MVSTPYNELIGTLGADSLRGSDYDPDRPDLGRDLILGLAGDDTIRSFSGSDTVYGGSGDDLIVDREPGNAGWFQSAGAQVAGSEFGNLLFGGAGNDRIVNQFNGFPGDYVSYFMSGGSGDDVLKLNGFATGLLFGGDGDDRIYLSGMGGIARGGNGNDVISAVNPRDIGTWYGWDRYTEAHADTLQGGAGDDKIFCYAGNADTIVFKPGDGRDTIRYLTASDQGDGLPVDRINLRAFHLDMSAEAFLASDRAIERDDRVILHPGDNGETLVIWNVTLEDLGNVLLL